MSILSWIYGYQLHKLDLLELDKTLFFLFGNSKWLMTKKITTATNIQIKCYTKFSFTFVIVTQ